AEGVEAEGPPDRVQHGRRRNRSAGRRLNLSGNPGHAASIQQPDADCNASATDLLWGQRFRRPSPLRASPQAAEFAEKRTYFAFVANAVARLLVSTPSGMLLPVA